MNHCGQSPSGFWLRKTRSSRSRTGSTAPEREQQLDAAPGTRRACPSRRPSTARARAARGSGSRRRGRTRAGSPPSRATSRRRCRRRAARQAPVMRRQKRAGGRGIARRESSRVAVPRAPRATSWPVMRSPSDVRGAGDQHHEGLAARAPVGEQQLVAADVLDAPCPASGRCGRRRRGSGGRRRCRGAARPTMPRASRVEADRHGVRRRRRRSARRGWTSGSGRAGRRATCDGEPELVPVARPPSCAPRSGRPRARTASARRSGVISKADGTSSSAPAAVLLDEDPLPVRAEQAEVRVRRREKAVDADVALREHRVEHAAHPHRGRERRLVGREALAGAQDLAVRPQARALLGRAARRARRAPGKKESSALAVALDRAALARRSARQLAGVELGRGNAGVRAEEASRRAGRAAPRATRVRGHGLGQRERAIDEGEIGGRRWPRGDRARASRRTRAPRRARRERAPARPGSRPSSARAGGARRAGAARRARRARRRRAWRGRGAGARRWRSSCRAPQRADHEPTDGGRRSRGSAARRARRRAPGCASGVWSTYWLT